MLFYLNSITGHQLKKIRTYLYYSADIFICFDFNRSFYVQNKEELLIHQTTSRT